MLLLLGSYLPRVPLGVLLMTSISISAAFWKLMANACLKKGKVVMLPDIFLPHASVHIALKCKPAAFSIACESLLGLAKATTNASARECDIGISCSTSDHSVQVSVRQHARHPETACKRQQLLPPTMSQSAVL